MVITQLMGGLGNQLFQYAMGRVLALQSGCELKIDTSFFANYEWHEYSLAPFAIKAAIATADECSEVKNHDRKLLNRMTKKLTGRHSSHIEEKNLLFDKSYLQLKAPVYISGYWQCEDYFKQHESEIRQDAFINIAPSEENGKILQQVQQCNAVSLHIRRGNFVNVAGVNAVHGTCPIDYYTAAIKYIGERVTAPVFFVFSDDIPWAKANLQSEYPFVFVEVNDAKHDYEDLRLMQNCKHHIIANSTFSWWGAWLNNRADKLVVAPKTWLADKARNAFTRDIVPGTWVKL